MARLFSMLEDALEQIDEKAGELGDGRGLEGLLGRGKQEKSSEILPPPPEPLPPIELYSESGLAKDVERRRAEIEARRKENDTSAVASDASEAGSPTPPQLASPLPEGIEGLEQQVEEEGAVEQVEAQQNKKNAVELELVREELELLTMERDALRRQNDQLGARVTAQESLLEETRERMHKQIRGLLEQKEASEKVARQAASERDTSRKELEMQYDEAVAAMKSKDKLIADLQSSKQLWVEEREEVGKKAGEALEKLRDELSEAEKKLEIHASSSSDLQEKVAKYEADMLDLHKEIEMKEEEVRNLNAIVQMKERMNQTTTEDLEQYRARVNKIVAEKDREVSLLQEQLNVSQFSSPQRGHDLTEAELTRAEPDTEKQRALQAVENLQVDLDRAKEEYRDLRNAKDAEDSQKQHQIAELQGNLEHQKSTVDRLQETVRSLQQQNSDYQQKLIGAKTETEAALREKETTIHQLEKRLEKKREDLNQSELSVQCRKLGESLMEKQAMLETKNAELEQLQMKLRGSQQRLRELELLSVPHKPTSSGVDLESQDALDYTPYQVRNSMFFQNLSQRSTAGKNVVTAAASVDQVAIRVGKLLRRHVLLRISLLVYFVFLHLWIFFFMGISLPNATSPSEQTGSARSE